MSHLAPSCHVMSYYVTSYHVESRGTVTRPTLHCQLTSSTRNQFKLSMTVFVGCPEGCRYNTASAVYDLVSIMICCMCRGVISTFSWGPTFFYFSMPPDYWKIGKQHFICSNLTLFIVAFFLFFSFFSFLSLFFFFLFFSFFSLGGDGPQPPKWRLCACVVLVHFC